MGRNRSLSLSKSQKISIFIYILILILVQMPWLKLNGHHYTIWQGYFLVKDDVVKLEFICLVLYQILCCIYIFTLLYKKNWYMGIVAELAAVVLVPLNDMGWSMYTEDWLGTVFVGIFILLGGAEFFLIRMLDVWEEAVKTAKESEEKERMEKEEERRRLYFPGKYPKLFYQVVWRNFLYNKRDYILFVICGIMACGLSFAGFGMYEMLAGLHTEERLFLGNGLGKIVQNAMMPLGVCTVFLLVFVLIFYLKKRTQSYSMFVTLGIRKKTLFLIMALELIASFVCAVILGFLAGRVILLIFRHFARLFLGPELALSPITWKVYGKALGVIFLIYLVSFMAARDIFMDFNLVSATARKLKSEKLPKKALIPLAVLGGAAVLWSVLRYTQICCFEKLSLLGLALAGMFFLMRFGGAAYLRRLRRDKKYLSRLIGMNHIYHKSRTCAWYLLTLMGLHLFVMFYFLFQIVSVTLAESPDTLYPYDFMCIADDGDEDFFGRLKETYQIELMTYPMVRVAGADNTEKTEGITEGIPPQSQHIGISETTYHELKAELDSRYGAKSLGLDEEGEKVYIVHQQDKSVRAQPTEWLYSKTRPYLHIGPVCTSFSPYWKDPELSYPSRRITGEEIGSLTGCFRQGRLENLIVFSDTYFEKAQELWKTTDMYTGEPLEEGVEAIPGVTVRQGPTRLVLIRAKASDVANLKQEMKELDESHAEELTYDMDVRCWYSRDDAAKDLKTERIMKPFLNIFVVITMTLAGIFVLYVKVMSEMEEKKRRAEFLECMGMRKEERIRLLRRELYLFYVVPFGTALLLTAAFTAATFYARMYTVTDIRAYLKLAIPLWICYGVFEWLVVWIFGKITVRSVEGKNEQ